MLATPLHSASPIEPIIIPPPSFNVHSLSFAQHRRLPGVASVMSQPGFVPYHQTKVELAATTPTTPDIIALADLFGTLKHTLATMSIMYGEIENQTEKMASLGPAMKATEQIKEIRAKLKKQIECQEASMQEMRRLLESAIQEDLIKQLKRKIYDTIRDTISKDIKERVQRELITQIPEQLRQQAAHQESQVQTNVLSPKSSHQAVNGELSPTEGRLRPLLRPLPTPAQSPAYVVNRARLSVESTNASPVSAFLSVPAPTPAVTSATFTRASTFYFTPPTPSPLVPSDILSLFSVGSVAKFTDYQISDERFELFPNPDSHSKGYPQPELGWKAFPRSGQIGNPLGNLNIADPREHETNWFDLPIGVPFLVVPAPIPRGPVELLSPIDPRKLLAPRTTGYMAHSERPRLHVDIPN